jgi:hypothetical protein
MRKFKKRFNPRTRILASPKGGYTVVAKDKNGNTVSTTTKTADGKGGYTVETKDKNGKVVSSTTYDSSGNVVSQTGKPQPIMAVGNVPKGTGGQPIGPMSPGIGSGASKVQAGVQQQIGDKSKVQDLIIGGKQEKLNVGTRALSTEQTSHSGGSGKLNLQTGKLRQTNQTSTVGGSGTQKIQTEVLHQMKEKTNVQNWGSSGASSGAGQIQHRRHR